MGQLLIELRCEELPVTMIQPAVTALEAGLLDLLEGIEHGAARQFATPRRLAVVVDDVAARRPVVRKMVTGPPADRAFDDNGRPTKAAEGFARGKGVDVGQLQVVDGPRGKVVAAPVTEGGEQTAEVVAEGLDALVRGMPFKKSMEWASGGVRWGRPLHGVSAVFEGQALNGTAAGLPISNRTKGHRLADYDGFAFSSFEQWLQGLEQRKVQPDLETRKARIRELLVEATAQLGCDPIVDDELLDEVVQLVEWPVLVVGAFDEDLLELPPRLLIETMKVHQRYFPVFKDGQLTRHFVVISNNPFGDHDLVAEGNARVLRPRFYDARFFYAEDRKKSLANHGEALVKMRWIRGLGTVADKQTRMAALAEDVARALNFTDDVARDAGAAGALCKADLTTQMVGEFPKLQGHMGRLYAKASGANEAVSLAIEEHYLPRYADDVLPTSDAGVAAALADRLDTLVACFGIGMQPKGGDPQGLRRGALGVVRILVGGGLRADVTELLRLALSRIHASAEGEPFDRWSKVRGKGPAPANTDELLKQLSDFVRARFRAWKVGSGLSGDLIDAVMVIGPLDPVVYDARCEALRAVSGTDEFLPIMHTFKRVLNITRGEDFPAPSRDQLTEKTELALFDAVSNRESAVADAVGALDFGRALDEVLALAAPVSAFFDDVLVDSPDAGEKARRMGLLLRVARVFLQVADFSRISTR